MRTRARNAVPVLVLALMLVLLVGCSGTGQTQNGGDQSGEQTETAQMQLDVVEQWAESDHAQVRTRPAGEEGCRNCHDGVYFTETGGGFQPRSQQATMSTETTGSAEATGAEEPLERDWAVAIDCRVCHTGVGAEVAQAGQVEGIQTLGTVEGGLGAVCMSCHSTWSPPGSREGELNAPHYSTETDVLFGANSLPVGSGESTGTGSQEETESPHSKVDDTCVGCHMRNADGEINHNFASNYEGCQREGCHNGDMAEGGDAKEDYDGDGQTEKNTAEVEGLMEDLEAAINQAAGSTDVRSESGQVVLEGAADVSPEDPAYAAAYNYLLLEKDGSRGIHNLAFTVRVLQDSIAGVSQE